MAKVIRTTVDAEGNVSIDFSGFLGSECETEEDHLRQMLAMLGLTIRAKSRLLRKRTATSRQGVPSNVYP